MRKRLLPVLLSLVLLLSLVPTAFAKPMTIVLEAAGDADKEFVYYMKTNAAYIDPAQGNVEKIEAMWKKCDCGFMVFGFQPNPDDIWRNHKLRCGKAYIYDTEAFNQITLKSGEKIAINTIASNPTIYMEQDAEYPIFYSTDGVNFTEYVNDPNIALAETTLAGIQFETIQNGTLTIRRGAASAAPGGVPAQPAEPTPSVPVFIDLKAGEYYVNAVNWAVEQGITNGATSTTFAPDTTCSQGQILTFLYRAARGTATAPTAEDMDKAVEWARAKGMIDGSFESGKACTRATAVSYIWQALGRAPAKPVTFADVDPGASYAGAVSWALENGVTNGTSAAANTFSPGKTCTRGQIVTFLHRAYVPSARLP